MKTKRKIYGAVCAAALAALIAFGSVILTACGAEDVFAAPEYEYYTAAAEVSSLAGSSVGSYGYYGVTGVASIASKTVDGQTQYALYSFPNNALIAPFASGTITSVNGLYYRSDTDGSLPVYSGFGYVCDADSASDIQRVVSGEIARVDCGSGNYKYVDLNTGEVTDVTEGLKAIASSADYLTDDYVIDVSSSYISVYDRETFVLERIIDVAAATGLDNNLECTDILDDGNFVAQYLIEVPASADYDYIDAGAYYDIRTFLIDVSSGKASEKNVNVAIASVANKYAYDNYSAIYSCDNTASVMMPEGDYMRSDSVIVELSNSLSIGKNLSEIFCSDSVTYLGYGKFYSSSNGRTANIVDEDGAVIASDIEPAGTRFFGKQVGDKYYVYDVRTMESINAEGFDGTSEMRCYGDSLLIVTERDGEQGYMTYGARTGTMSAFTAGSVETIAFTTCGIFSVSGDGSYSLMSVSEDGGTVTLASGTSADFELLTAYAWTDERGNVRTGYLASSVKNGETVYYRITA